MTVQAAIIIPARYGSTRFEGKPMAMLGGYPMLCHVAMRAKLAAKSVEAARDVAISVIVATDDDRIAALCREYALECVMTSDTCRTGSDRVLEAVQHLNDARRADGADDIEIVLNLQGDNPFASVEAVSSVMDDLIAHEDHPVATPILPLEWAALDTLRAQKKVAPYSGTTVTVDKAGKALWFSKMILPAMRREDDLRAASDMSPVCRHIGLYGYRVQALRQFVELPEGEYEALEGLEQLRFLENGIDIYTCKIDPQSMPPVSGIDTQADLDHANKLIDEGVIALPDFDDLKG